MTSETISTVGAEFSHLSDSEMVQEIHRLDVELKALRARLVSRTRTAEDPLTDPHVLATQEMVWTAVVRSERLGREWDRRLHREQQERTSDVLAKTAKALADRGGLTRSLLDDLASVGIRVDVLPTNAPGGQA